MENLNANKRGLREINEGGINRIMGHGKHGFIIISANRSDVYSDNPRADLSKEYDDFLVSQNLKRSINNERLFLAQRNKEAEAGLLKDIKQADYAYTPVFGGYHGQDNVSDSFEPSFIVYNHNRGGAINYGDFNKLKNFALEMCKKYKQESVYVQAPDEAPVYLDGEGNVVNTKSSLDFKINRPEEEYYTTVKREKRTTDQNGLTNAPQRFTADIRFESMFAHKGAGSLNERMRRSKSGEIFLFN